MGVGLSFSGAQIIPSLLGYPSTQTYLISKHSWFEGENLPLPTSNAFLLVEFNHPIVTQWHHMKLEVTSTCQEKNIFGTSTLARFVQKWWIVLEKTGPSCGKMILKKT
jgi:hypothetical protein